MSFVSRRPAFALAAAVVLGVAAWTACGAAPEPDAPGADGVLVLTLDKAVEGARTLVVYLEIRGGALPRGFAIGREVNRSWHDVDASGLRLADGRLAGEVRVTIRPDPWFPKDGRPVACVFALDAAVAGDAVSGTFRGTCGGAAAEGTLTGRRAAAGPPDPARLDLVLVRGVSKTSTHWSNLGHLLLTLARGRAAAPRMHAPNNTTYADFTCLVRAAEAAVTDGRLSAALRVAVTPAGDKLCAPGEYTYALEGLVLADAAVGTFTARCGNAEVAADRFQGTVRPAPPADPAEATYALELHGAVPGGKAMWVHAEARGGAVDPGLAYTPHFNRAVHDVDASGLKVAGGRVRGEVRVTVHADPYVPKDGRDIACVYTVDAALADGGLAGTFTGTFGPEAVAGVVAGLYGPRPTWGDAVRLSMKLEEGVTGGAPWLNRTYLGVTLRGGRAVEGQCSNNKDGWQGRFDGADLRFDGRTLAGRITCTLVSGRVRLGTYTFAVDGRVVGEQLVGTYTSTLEGREVKRGRFMGGVERAE